MEEEKNWLVKSISHDQHEILYNIMRMHNNGKPYDCDMTYSKGNFYGKFKMKLSDGSVIDYEIPKPLHKFDVSPMDDETVRIEPDGKLPLEDFSIESIVIDLPFVVSPPTAPSITEKKKGSNIIFNRFHGYYPVKNLFKSYSHWIKEAYRVLKDGGICVFKTQNTISGSVFYCTEEFSWLEAQKNGFYVLDRFTLVARNRLISGKVKNQQHARNFSSVFWVFKKGGKHKVVDYYKFLDD